MISLYYGGKPMTMTILPLHLFCSSKLKEKQVSKILLALDIVLRFHLYMCDMIPFPKKTYVSGYDLAHFFEF